MISQTEHHRTQHTPMSLAKMPVKISLVNKKNMYGMTHVKITLTCVIPYIFSMFFRYQLLKDNLGSGIGIPATIAGRVNM